MKSFANSWKGNCRGCRKTREEKVLPLSWQPTALPAKSVYAEVLKALDNLAKQSGANGLEFWEQLAQQAAQSGSNETQE